MTTSNAGSPAQDVRLYDEEGELLLSSDHAMDRVTLLPLPPAEAGVGRIRILWGQDMLRDVLDGRYRAVVCGVNDEDNSHGIIAQLVDLTTTSQWTAKGVTSFAKMFHESAGIHAAAEDREPYILKYDLDSIVILALLRPRGKDHFSLDDVSRGFKTVTKMLKGRRERQPVASVSFLGARSNRLIDDSTGAEPSFETVLRTLHQAGYKGDIYPSPRMWQYGNVGVYPSFPFPPGLDTMRAGGH